MRLALLSIENLSGFVADDELVVEPLRQLGCVAEFVPWQSAVEWQNYDGVIIRTTWNYQDHLEEFLGVLRQIERQSRLANSLETVRWNADKSIYLPNLAQRGARIVPTIWNNNRIEKSEIEQWFDQLQADEIVIKPTVGANAQHAFRLKREKQEIATLRTVFDNRSFMVQPFMRAIVEEGEFSLFYFNGEYSHAILKTPKPGDFRVQEEHGGRIQPIKPSRSLLAAGEKILKHVSPTPLYARADFVRTEGDEFALVELELIEPSLYLREAEHAPHFFAKAINQWLSKNRR
jgi:glutathione synthase/RimK-type ligase-like ATP-grasp enzyme